MSYSRFAFACLVGFSLSCHPGLAQTAAEATACMANIYNSPEAAPLRPHVPLNPVNATPSQLSDPSYPTPSETAAIKAVYPRLRDCQQQAMTALSRILPGLAPVAERLHAAREDDVRLLIQRRLSWGEAITRYRDRALILQAEMQRLPEYRAAVAAQAQRQAAAQQALLQDLAEQQRAAQAPVTRPCVSESHGNVFGALAMALAPCPPGTPRPYTDALERQFQPATPMNCMDLGSGIISCQQGLRTFTCLRSGATVSCQ